ncbi:LuxR C-terminal-related transcriptional regulator [Noviherbaspirillum sp. CPCC 100848]|uniref:LuxR C-terminal-related transcriptional regulator n=1 Tax=Noviherbaspirillum album TaxID=3080276 RepID=A0ABU6J9W4_9BURK|nr:LuxR C-terminal-related transcriptional regulator [Noviherbaspirillum sp. CPCC 100848]MEC4720100.1 LuxR C-terminal-related transcriptional regulator [Noviherbaspirillum sp. CPCC 100848]
MGTSERVSPDQVISTFYDAALDPSLWQSGLTRFASLMDSQGSILMLADPGRAGAEIAFNVGYSEEVVSAYNDYYNTLDPLVGVVPYSQVGCWTADANGKAWPDQKNAREYHNDLLRKHDIGGILASLAVREDRLVATISVQRFGLGNSYRDDDHLAAREVMPHLQRAIRLHFRMQELQIPARIAQAALDHVAAPMLAVDGACNLLFANRAAERLLSRQCGIVVRFGKVSTCSRALEVQQAIAQAASTTASRGSAYSLDSGSDDAMHLLVLPMPLRLAAAHFNERPMALIVVHETGRSCAGVESSLRDLYGLTPMEARIGCMLADGLSTQEIADEQSISMSTLRTHLKSVFSKTGLRRQAALTQMIATLASIGSSSEYH